jgi:hypothetical protein
MIALSSFLAVALTTFYEPGQQLEAGTSLSVVGLGYTYLGGQLGDVHLGPGVFAEGRPTQRGGWTDRLLLSGALAATVPVSTDGPVPGAASVLRLGAELERVVFLLGVHTRFDATPNPIQVLPSAAVSVRLSQVALTMALLERPVGPWARLAVSYRGLGLAYLAPMGGELFGRWRLSPTLVADVRPWGLRTFNAYSVGAAVTFASGL